MVHPAKGLIASEREKHPAYTPVGVLQPLH